MVSVNSLVFPLLDRVGAIDEALATCADESKRKELLTEREIKADLLKRLLDDAINIRFRRGKQREV